MEQQDRLAEFEDSLMRNPANEFVSAGTRFGNYILDVIVFYALNFVWLMVVDSMMWFLGPFESLIITYGIMFAYYTVMEGALGATVGKLITGTVVVNEVGEKITFGQAAGRSLCRFIPFEAFSFLGKGRGWHDTITKTYVVKKDFLN